MTRLLVGNDVVDLADPRCVGKASDERFLERVLSREEARQVRGSTRPDTLLWLFWAAKEAGYKVASKVRSEPPPFVHAGFRVSLREAESLPPEGAVSGPGPALSGRVDWEELSLPFRASIEGRRIHTVAWWAQDGPLDASSLPPGLSQGVTSLPEEGPADDWREALVGRFTSREWGPVHSWHSAVVRLEARAELARRLGVDEQRIQIVCPGDAIGRTPPRVVVDGKRAVADVSLSHHRRFVAWCVAVSDAATVGSAGGR